MKKKDGKPLSVADIFGELGSNLNRVAVSPNVHSYKAHLKQEMFHKAIERTRLYIGGNRSGKTTGGIVEDIWWLSGKHPYQQTPDPTIRPVLGRLVSVDFNNGIAKIILPQLKQWLPPSLLVGGSWEDSYSAGERTLTLANGSQLELMSYDQDLDKFAGTSRDFIHFDEEPPKAIFTECKARLIDRKGKSWITMTPVEGMTWMFDDIYQPGVLGQGSIKVIEVDMEDNPHLDRDEINEFLSGLDESEKAARKQGRFVQMGGLIYKKFNLDTHVIPQIDFKEFADVRKYKIYMSLDHGLNNPTSVHWHAVDKEGRVITFDEHYESQRIIDYHATVIHQRNAMHNRVPDFNIMDPACAQRNAVTGTSIQTEYAIRGVGFALANNDVRTGIAKVSQYVNIAPDGRPYWLITQNCGNLIKEIQRYRWKTWASKKQQDQNNPYDEPHKKDDHAMDDCRYFFSFMPELKNDYKEPADVATENLHKFMKNHAGNSATDIWHKVDPNLTKESLTRKSIWTPNPEEYWS